MTIQDPQFADAKVIDNQAIPVIDLSLIIHGDPASVSEEALKSVGESIHSAAMDVGFFYVKGHGISQELIDTALQTSQAFFQLSEVEKAEVKVNHNQKGWMRPGMAKMEGSKTHDLKEVFFYGREIAATDPDLNKRCWPITQQCATWVNRFCPQSQLDSIYARTFLLPIINGPWLEGSWFTIRFLRITMKKNSVMVLHHTPILVF